jgi:hypothetical protein
MPRQCLLLSLFFCYYYYGGLFVEQEPEPEVGGFTGKSIDSAADFFLLEPAGNSLQKKCMLLHDRIRSASNSSL